MSATGSLPAGPRSNGTGRDETAPYVGLSFYTEEDAPLFFGRGGERHVIMGNLRASRLTLLYAQSGVGKSSLLRAALPLGCVSLQESRWPAPVRLRTCRSFSAPGRMIPLRN